MVALIKKLNNMNKRHTKLSLDLMELGADLAGEVKKLKGEG
jgi:hypothetical protein